jgi:glutathione synthase/RimK-type ligase-like ATP-grasp enzyme
LAIIAGAIGLILIITNRQDITADFLILELQRRRTDYIRFNTEDFPQKVQIDWELSSDGIKGYLIFPRRNISFQEINSVWYRRPVPPTLSKEITSPQEFNFALRECQAAFDGFLKTLDCFWVSSPENVRKAENKLLQLKLAIQTGWSVWPTKITNIPTSALSFYKANDGKVIYKPLHGGRIIDDEKVHLIFTSPISQEEADKFEKVQYAPVLLQKYIPKSIEIRVTVIGKKVFPVEIHSQLNPQALHDWRRVGSADLLYKIHYLPKVIEERCLSIVEKCGLQFGAIDLILTPEGEYVFLEINPNGQWAWIQQKLPEIPLRETLADLLIDGGLK